MNQVWEKLSMDFTTNLPSSFGHSVVRVVYGRFTKHAYFLALPSQFIALVIAKCFSMEICHLHDMPKSIVFDRDLVFPSDNDCQIDSK